MTIASDIRAAALKLHPYGWGDLGMVETHIVNAFLEPVRIWTDEPKIQWPTFMLFVAESLEPSLPVDDLLLAADFMRHGGVLSSAEVLRLAAVLRGLAGGQE